MTELPPIPQKDADNAILKQLNVDGTTQLENPTGIRKYTDFQLERFDDETRIQAVVGAKRAVMRTALREQKKSALARINHESPWETQPPLTVDEANALYDKDVLTEDQIEEKVLELVPDAGQSEPETPELPSEEEGGGKSLPADEYVPSVQVSAKQRQPKVASEDVMKEVRPQIDPTIDFEKYRPPSVLPISTLSTMDMFVEPISRQMFVVLYQSPVGFFYFCVHVPCAYPLVLPPFYPVTTVGKAPAGAIALAFMDPTLPYCGGSQPYDVEVDLGLGMPPIDRKALAADIQPCDPTLPAAELSECMKRFNEDARELLGPMPIPKELQELLNSIQEQTEIVLPPPVAVDPVTGEEFVITVDDGLEGFDFQLDIIE